MMNLSIGRCVSCKKIRLVDKTSSGMMCFACKQKRRKK